VDGDWCLVLADGRQRTINLRAANEKRAKDGLEPLRIPIRVIDVTGTDILKESVILNEHRISDNPISKAMKAKAMLDKGMSKESIARSFRVKPSTLTKQWFPVLGMAPIVIEAVKTGKMALNAALELSSLTHEEQEAEFKKLEEAGQLNMAAAEASRRRVREGGEKESGSSEGGEGEEKAASPYKPFSKKYMAAFVKWSDAAGKAGNSEEFASFHALGIDKDGNMVPARTVLREFFQHLLGKKVTPGIPGWKKMVARMETPVEEKAEDASEEKAPAKSAKKGAKKGAKKAPKKKAEG
jgi:hypothetical protein